MTPRHWFKMVASALVVFVLGLALTQAVNAGSHRAREMVIDRVAESHHSMPDVNVPVEGLVFRLHDTPLGVLQKLSVVRSGPTDVSGLNITVKLNDGLSADQFTNCQLTLDNPAKISKESRFLCLTPSDAGYGDLLQFGTVTFVSSGHRSQTHLLEVPSSFFNALQQASAQAEALSSAQDADLSNSDGHVQVTVNGKKVVDIAGDEAGGSVIIRDPLSGAKLIDIQGSDAGGSVIIRDPSTGKSILEIVGNDAGGTVKVNGMTAKNAKAAAEAAANAVNAAKVEVKASKP